MFQKKAVRWSVIAAAAAVVLVIGFRPGLGPSPGDGAAWADGIRQIREARSAHIHMVGYNPQPGEPSGWAMDQYMRSPDKIRIDASVASSGHKESTIVDGVRTLKLDHVNKLGLITHDNPLSALSVQQFLAREFVFPDEAPATQAAGRPSATRTFVGAEQRDGRKLLKYRWTWPEPTTQTRPAPADAPTTYFWFDAADKKLTLLTGERIIDGKPVEYASATVNLNVDLADDLFSTQVPPGYTVIPEGGLLFGADAELVDLYARYQRARDRIQKYRLLMCVSSKPLGPEGWYLTRSVRDGRRWRVDGMTYVGSPLTDGFETVWRGMVPVRLPRITFTYQGRVALIREPGIEPRAVWEQSPYAERNLLAGLGWPAWPTTHAPSFEHPGFIYQRLPARADRAGLIGIRVESDRRPSSGSRPSEQQQELRIYWIDPVRDYLCVRYESYTRFGKPWQGNLNWQPTEPETDQAPQGSFSEYDELREITAFDRTPEGHWYPREVRNSSASIVNGKSHHTGTGTYPIQAEFTGSIPDELFDWPADVPKPK